jgi:hypothetical protein
VGVSRYAIHPPSGVAQKKRPSLFRRTASKMSLEYAYVVGRFLR